MADVSLFRPRGTKETRRDETRRDETKREEKRSHRNEEKQANTQALGTESPDHGVVHVASQIRTDRFPVGSLSPPMPPWQPDPTIKRSRVAFLFLPRCPTGYSLSTRRRGTEQERERDSMSRSSLFAKIRSRFSLSLSLFLSTSRLLEHVFASFSVSRLERRDVPSFFVQY